jgi:hypothetical protein
VFGGVAKWLPAIGAAELKSELLVSLGRDTHIVSNLQAYYTDFEMSGHCLLAINRHGCALGTRR